MKFRKFGRIALALAVSLGTGLGVTSCTTDNTVGYLWVTSSKFNQISGYKIDNNLGQLTPTPSSPYPSGGVNPIRILVANGGRFIYVLNTGCGTSQTPCPPNTPSSETGASIALFTVGGGGSLFYQASYSSQGSSPISILTDASGRFLYVLDSVVPDPTTCIGYSSTNPATVCGDITAFNIDSNTGRLALITNQTVKNANGTNLTYFPIGSGPINFAISGGAYLYTIEKGSGAALDPFQAAFVYALSSSTGQLTLTQNTPIPTNAQNLTYIYASSSHVYLLDAGDGTTPGVILPYTSSSNGALQSQPGGAVPNTGETANPGTMIVDHTNKFVYIANQGPNLTPNSPGSTVSAFFINSNSSDILVPLSSGTAANTVAFGSGASPRCILEDPTNQYLYTANYDGSITGGIINQQTGTLTNLRKNSSFQTPDQATWCVASGTLF